MELMFSSKLLFANSICHFEYVAKVLYARKVYRIKFYQHGFLNKCLRKNITHLIILHTCYLHYSSCMRHFKTNTMAKIKFAICNTFSILCANT